MQVTNLNKTINLLIVGTFALLNVILIDIWFYHSSHLNDLSKLFQDKKINDSQALIGLFSVSPVIFLGIVIETIAEVFRNFIGFKITKPTNSSKISGFFYTGKEYNKYAFWKKRITELFGTEFKEHGSSNSVATTIFFEKAKEVSVNWVINHYAVYILVTDFVVILAIDVIYFIYFHQWLTVLYTLILIWILLSQSLGKFFYAYAFLFRFSALHAESFLNRFDSNVKNSDIEPKKKKVNINSSNKPE